METSWLLIADAARARVFEIDASGSRLVREPVKALHGSTAATSDIVSDRAGRTFDRTGAARHAKEPHTDPHRYEKLRFADEIANMLAVERHAGRFDRLVVVVPPQMLGDLRARFSPSVRAAVQMEAAKDLSRLSAHDLEQALGALMHG